MDRRREPVRRVVDELDALVEAGDAKSAATGPKSSSQESRRPARCALDERRRDVPAALAESLMPPASSVAPAAEPRLHRAENPVHALPRR